MGPYGTQGTEQSPLGPAAVKEGRQGMVMTDQMEHSIGPLLDEEP